MAEPEPLAAEDALRGGLFRDGDPQSGRDPWKVGPYRIVARLDHYAGRDGNPHGYWTVSPLLRNLGETGGRLSEWRRAD